MEVLARRRLVWALGPLLLPQAGSLAAWNAGQAFGDTAGRRADARGQQQPLFGGLEAALGTGHAPAGALHRDLSLLEARGGWACKFVSLGTNVNKWPSEHT